MSENPISNFAMLAMWISGRYVGRQFRTELADLVEKYIFSSWRKAVTNKLHIYIVHPLSFYIILLQCIEELGDQCKVVCIIYYEYLLLRPGLEKTRVFLKKNQPSGFFGFLWVFLGFFGFFGFFWVFLGFCPDEGVFRVFFSFTNTFRCIQTLNYNHSY
jgi:hypothetical protein